MLSVQADVVWYNMSKSCMCAVATFTTVKVLMKINVVIILVYVIMCAITHNI